MIAAKTDGRRIRIAASYAIAACLAGLACRAVVSGIVGIHWFGNSDKFLVPTIRYWCLLGLSLLVALIAGQALCGLLGWSRLVLAHPSSRYLLAAVFVLGALPAQVLLAEAKWMEDGQIRLITSIDTFGLLGGLIAAAIPLTVGLVRHSSAKRKLALNILLFALLWVLPTGVFALLLSVAIFTINRRWSTYQTVLLAICLLIACFVSVGLFLALRISLLPGIWAICAAIAAGFVGYKLHAGGSNEQTSIPISGQVAAASH